MQPLTAASDMQRIGPEGRDVRALAESIISPNDRLTSFERLELYNRQYWFRLLDCMFEDYPGLLAVIGNDRFVALCEAYLCKYPSNSGLLRDLGYQLERFITDESRWTAPHTKLAADMARFEWAQTVAFDGAARPAVKPQDLQGQNPATLRLGLQPYITLMQSAWALDDHLKALKKRQVRDDASNASLALHVSRRRAIMPPRRKTFLAIHRLNNQLFIKRLDAMGYAILCSIRDGATLAAALETALNTFQSVRDVTAATAVRRARVIQQSFQTWAQLGWFCRPE